MRLKHIIFILLLLLANVTILAHSVIPHIHHDGIVCMKDKPVKHAHANTACTDNTACNEYGCCQKHDERPSTDTMDHNNVEDCDLPNLLQRQSQSNVRSITHAISDLSLLYITLPYSIGCFYCYNLNTAIEIEPLETPYIYNYTSPYVGNAYSLRAPPVCFLG